MSAVLPPVASQKAPIVVIVGRPNVGKSTLFNRLTGRRTALVSDEPGLTRDRREGDADLWRHTVTLVDTAGLEETAPGTIAARMRAQTETAIATADLVLFVIDARSGLTPVDQAFARLVHAAGRPAILVANKCESRMGRDGLYETFALGLGDPVAISAEHGEGIGDLTHEIAAALGLTSPPSEDADEPQTDAPSEDPRPIRVAIVGRPNAGKSTLVNALLGEERMITGPEPGLTRDAIASDVDWNGRAIRLFDTAGLRRKAKVIEEVEQLSTGDSLRAIRFAEVVVMLMDAEHPLENQDLTIADLVAREGRALVLAINKWDLVEDKQRTLRALQEALPDKLSQVPGVALVPVSALAGRGLDRLQKAVLDAHAIWNRRVATHDLNRWLAEALARHAPPQAPGRRVKIRYITQPSTRPPSFVAFCSRPEELPQSYVKYLTKSLRATFDLPGVPIRMTFRKSDNPYVDRGR